MINDSPMTPPRTRTDEEACSIALEHSPYSLGGCVPGSIDHHHHLDRTLDECAFDHTSQEDAPHTTPPHCFTPFLESFASCYHPRTQRNLTAHLAKQPFTVLSAAFRWSRASPVRTLLCSLRRHPSASVTIATPLLPAQTQTLVGNKDRSPQAGDAMVAACLCHYDSALDLRLAIGKQCGT
jgi:hypothetical protein